MRRASAIGQAVAASRRAREAHRAKRLRLTSEDRASSRRSHGRVMAVGSRWIALSISVCRSGLKPAPRSSAADTSSRSLFGLIVLPLAACQAFSIAFKISVAFSSAFCRALRKRNRAGIVIIRYQRYWRGFPPRPAPVPESLSSPERDSPRPSMEFRGFLFAGSLAAGSRGRMSAESIRLRVEVGGDGIIVTKSGQPSVIYRKQAHTTELVAFDVRGAPGAAISQVEFLARAWKLANHKARERGGLCEDTSASAGAPSTASAKAAGAQWRLIGETWPKVAPSDRVRTYLTCGIPGTFKQQPGCAESLDPSSLKRQE
jgi:hypothetical protein